MVDCPELLRCLQLFVGSDLLILSSLWESDDSAILKYFETPQ